MENLSTLFTDLYTKFLLRDIVGKIVPGALLWSTVLYMFFAPKQLLAYFRRLPIAGLVIVGGFIWTVTLGFQSAAEMLRIWSYFPQVAGAKTPSDSFAVSTLRVVEFQRCADDVQLLQYERFVVIKEACGNLFFAMLLSVVPATFVWIRTHFPIAVQNTGWKACRWMIVAALVALVFVGLHRMHLQHVERQFMYADALAKRQLTPPPPCWPAKQPTVAKVPNS